MFSNIKLVNTHIYLHLKALEQIYSIIFEFAYAKGCCTKAYGI